MPADIRLAASSTVSGRLVHAVRCGGAVVEIVKRMTGPRLSVILCTFDAKRDYLKRSLESISHQTIPGDQFELLVVDNNSSPPINFDWVVAHAAHSAIVIEERRQGLTHARIAGIVAAAGRVICFVDDDNLLAPNYLEEALKIAIDEPGIGAFGGAAVAVLERQVSAGFAHFLPYFGMNDHGADPITGRGDVLGPWTPIGAGLCIRREVADAFVKHVSRSRSAQRLGRAGSILMSGEDSLFSYLASRLGFEVGYRPTLRLDHVISAERLNLSYLARLMEGHGRSHVILRELFDQNHFEHPSTQKILMRVMNVLHRLKSHGPTRAFGMYFWDRGAYLEESRRRRE